LITNRQISIFSSKNWEYLTKGQPDCMGSVRKKCKNPLKKTQKKVRGKY
jgi:hypothetical protein